MPRILCLHGHGTSAAIFKSQTAAFRAKLDSSFEFEFIDAPFSSRAAPGINAIYKTPTYTWWPQATPQAIRTSHRWVADYISEHGPYDAVCCFSQGCSLAASMALYHAVDTAAAEARGEDGGELPFRAAIFICGGLPLPVLEDMGLEVSPRAHDINRRTGELLNNTAARLHEMAADLKLIKPGVGLWDGLRGGLVHDADVRPPRSDVFGLDFTEFPPSARIGIPTLNIYGSKDPRWPAGVQLAEFCEDTLEFDHGGGHDIPRSTTVSNKIASMITELMSRA